MNIKNTVLFTNKETNIPKNEWLNRLAKAEKY